jgi:Protein of unknown function (DUF3467)
MADESHEQTASRTPPALAPAPAHNVRVDLNTASLNTTYANFFRVTGTFEEIVLDFGLHTGAILPQGPEPVRLAQRLILSFPTAKRLLAALEVAVSRHEQAFGGVDVEPHKRAKRGG